MPFCCVGVKCDEVNYRGLPQELELRQQAWGRQVLLDIEATANIQEWIMQQSFMAASLFNSKDTDDLPRSTIYWSEHETNFRPDGSL